MRIRSTIFVCGLLILSISIGLLEYYNLGYGNAIESAGAFLFSGLLVLLYYRQSAILDKQEGLMEHQNRMMMESHRPQLIFEIAGFDPEIDVVSFNVKNVGPGAAYDIGLEFKLDSNGEDNLKSYGQVVDVEGEKPASLGVLRASEEKLMDFEIHLPNPNQGAEQQSLPVSEALSEFDYTHCTSATIRVKEVYADVRGVSRGSSIIEQITFEPVYEPVNDVEELWSYGAKYLDIEEVWNEP